MSEPELIVVADPDGAAAAAAKRIATALADAVADHGRADWATTGGSSVVGIYRHLVAEPLRDAVPWEAVHVWWGDDRYVPRDHPLSNVKPLDDILPTIGLTEEGVAGGRGPGVPLPVENLHPFPTGEAIGVPSAEAIRREGPAVAFSAGGSRRSRRRGSRWPPRVGRAVPASGWGRACRRRCRP